MPRLWRWLWPAVCLLCGAELDRIAGPFCRRCHRSKQKQGWVSLEGQELEGLYAGCRFEGVAREAVLRFKYARRFYLGRFFARWIGRRPPFPIDAETILLPIPMATLRRWLRGYNPAEVFAAELARRWRLPLKTGWLKRHWRSHSQTRLRRGAREKNARKSYRLASRRRLPSSVILVDDVVTTGATLRACARLLRSAGVKRVWGIAIAYDRLG